MFKRTLAAVMILAVTLCLGVKVDTAKPTQWLIYRYVCGTDIWGHKKINTATGYEKNKDTGEELLPAFRFISGS